MPYTENLSARVAKFSIILHQFSVGRPVLLKNATMKASVIKMLLNHCGLFWGTPYSRTILFFCCNSQAFFNQLSVAHSFMVGFFFLEEVTTESNP